MANNHKSVDQLEAEQLAKLRKIAGPEHKLESLNDLSKLPVLRKDELLKSQRADPPFGLLKPVKAANIYQSPGPVYEPGLPGTDPWRLGKFLKAIGIGSKDVVQNTFAYHFTPAGAMFESAARAVDAVVFPAGPGQSRQQCEVAQSIKTTVYAGTPDFLKIILNKADEEGYHLNIKHAAVSAGPLFPQLRQEYADRGIVCRQCYGTADVGLISYETQDCIDGMFVDDEVIVEIVSPGTGDPLAVGEIGEVLVTVLNEFHPILRFSTGDLSAYMADTAGETQKRIVGWRGRADQATKVRGMFIRPEQVSEIVNRHPQIERARVEVSLDGTVERIDVKIESSSKDPSLFTDLVQETLKLKTQISVVDAGVIPRDGVLVSDLREQAV